MIVAIHQPNYLPWLGYFHKISAVDTFVFFDNVQMPIGKSFVSRNRIKTPQGEQWLTVPTHRDSNGSPIAETAIQPGNWPRKHLMTIRTAYAGSPWLEPVLDGLQREFGAGEGTIADLNVRLVRMCAAFIGLTAVKFLRATEMGLESAGAESGYEILDRTGTKRVHIDVVRPQFHGERFGEAYDGELRGHIGGAVEIRIDTGHR